MPAPDADLLPAIRAAAAEAGALASRRWTDGFARWEKVPGHPVCEVDLEVDALLHDRLAAIDPAAGWLSEETADSPDRLVHRRVWIVDPIDGTRDYLRGRPGWCVSIALVEDRQLKAAVLAAPALDQCWWATRGGGAFRDGQRLRASHRTTLPGARVPADTLPRMRLGLEAVPRSNSIALRIAMVAADTADLCATLRWGNEWDVAAAVLIAEEAGASVSDAFGRTLRFNGPDARLFGILASAGAIHAEARAALAPLAATIAAAS